MIATPWPARAQSRHMASYPLACDHHEVFVMSDITRLLLHLAVTHPSPANLG